MENCAICDKIINEENSKILSMGVYGTPKYLCEECAADIDEVTLGRDYEKIANAMDRVGQKMANGSPDKVTFDTVNEIMASSAERARLIKEGEYDFSLDEVEDIDEEQFDEIPEELKESEEDRELDRRDEEALRKFDKVYNVILILAVAATAGILIWRLLDMFVF